MHDGQMLYDAATTWNKQSWEVDEVAGKLISEGKIKKFIVVGIWNNSQKRHPEYFPQKPYESLNQTQKDTITAQLQKAGRTKEIFHPISDLYLKFVVTELKPYIDSHFATIKNKENTVIAGSSMGGLISMYAICEYPEVFGGAACISTHWPGTFSSENNPIPNAFIQYMESHLPNPKTHQIYFDYGNKTLDALYPELQKKVDALMQKKGFTNTNWSTQFFDGKDHSEKSWAERLHIPLQFLFKK
jgi:enterochelin esterase-like enzyme